jgi:hypothetical protein
MAGPEGEGEEIGFLVARNDEELRLHAALRHREPLEVIQEIVRPDPASIRRKDGNGALPLHVAARHGARVEVVPSGPGREAGARMASAARGCPLRSVVRRGSTPGEQMPSRP